MPKFEYITCNRDYKDETTEEFLEKINILGEKRWEAIAVIPTILSNFDQVLFKREKERE